MSREAWWTCADESSFVNVTHFTTRAAMLTGGGLTTLVMTGGFRTGLTRRTLDKKVVRLLVIIKRIIQLKANNSELKQPRRQRQGKRHFKNDFQIFQTSSR